jgi:hypothetical protein
MVKQHFQSATDARNVSYDDKKVMETHTELKEEELKLASVEQHDYSIGGGKYDILLAKSSDGGNSFGKTINVSHNLGFSFYPAIATSPLSKK